MANEKVISIDEALEALDTAKYLYLKGGIRQGLICRPPDIVTDHYESILGALIKVRNESTVMVLSTDEIAEYLKSMRIVYFFYLQSTFDVGRDRSSDVAEVMELIRRFVKMKYSQDAVRLQ